MAQPFHTQLAVPVAGGSLAVGVAGAPLGNPDIPIVLLVHGITGSHRSWAPVARHLGDSVTVLAPDLRGRGQSSGIEGPYGMAAHVEDLLAILDVVECSRAVVAGHSMGGYVVARLAAAVPERVRATILVDGGLPLAVPPGLGGSGQSPGRPDSDALLAAVLGPSLSRLDMTFPSVDAYRDFWRAHPAFAPLEWTEDIVDYVDYDLAPPDIDPEGGETRYRSRVSQAAVRADGRDLLDADGARKALDAVGEPAVLLWAARGLQNENRPLLSAESIAEARALLPHLVVSEVPDTNHYLILLGDREAAVVAGAIRRSATS